MLPEFVVPIVLGGEPSALLVQDVPACVFWQGYPDTANADLTDRNKRAAEAAWLRHLLVRVTALPELDLVMVQEMGDDAWLPTRAYLEAIGFFPRPVPAAVTAEMLRAIPALPKRTRTELRDREFGAFRGCIPPEHVQQILRMMAGALRGITVPGLWLMPASEFFFAYHVGLTDEQKGLAPLPEVRE